jgi:hypothetical protein
MTTKNAATAHLLEGVNPGPGRWWKVELLKNVATKPIKVSLMESQVDGRVALSRPIGYTRTIATPKAVREAADLVLTQVGDYLKVVGEYGVTDSWDAQQQRRAREQAPVQAVI